MRTFILSHSAGISSVSYEFSCFVVRQLLSMTIFFISIESDYIRRTLPSVLKEGEPNLLLVPKGMLQNMRFQFFKCQ
jgi:hypothetical protein